VADSTVKLGGTGDGENAHRRYTCPSGRCLPGVRLIGVVGPSGRLGYVGGSMTVDDDFVQTVEMSGKTGVPPLRRFRFAEPCVESDCLNWTGTHCGLIDEVLEVRLPEGAVSAETNLPRCGIRASCRWFHQTGRKACAVCPLITRGGESKDATDSSGSVSLPKTGSSQ
jgi:hypothetical protein